MDTHLTWPTSVLVVYAMVAVVPQLVTTTNVLTAPSSRRTGHYTDQGRLVERFFDNRGRLLDCNVYGDRMVSESVIKEIPRESVLLVDDVKFQEIVRDCAGVQLRSWTERHDRRKRQIQLIYPGTKWCGDGNIAANYSDLGNERETDKCCRTHDHCPKSVLPGETKFGVENTGLITISHCDCDDVFFHCLRADNTDAAEGVGDIFFNVLEISCIEEDFSERCAGFWFWRKCRKSKTGRQMVIKETKHEYPVQESEEE